MQHRSTLGLTSAALALLLTCSIATTVGATTHPVLGHNLPTGNFDQNPAGPLLWSENFTGAAPSGPNFKVWNAVQGWYPYGGGVGTNTATPFNLELNGWGNLDMIARCVAVCTNPSQGLGAWTTARINTDGKVYFQYGQLEARIWMPAGSFNWPAFWMLGRNFDSPDGPGWPFCGEVDIMEGLQGENDDQATLHAAIPGQGATDWSGGGGLTQTAPISAAVMTSGWHTYGILWAPNSITFTLDGTAWASDTYNPTTTDVTQVVGNSTTVVGPGTGNTSNGGDWPFNQPFFLILDNAVGGVASDVAPNNATSHMLVDWINYYQYQGYGQVTLAS